MRPALSRFHPTPQEKRVSLRGLRPRAPLPGGAVAGRRPGPQSSLAPAPPRAWGVARRGRPARRPARRPSPLPLLLSLALLLSLFGCRWWVARPQAGPGAQPAPPPAVPPTRAGVPALEGASLLLAAPPAVPPAHPDPALQAVVERAAGTGNGRAAIVVRHLISGASASTNEGEVYRSASLAKVPVLVEAYRQLAAGTLRADEALPITEDSITDGAGVLQARAGERVPVSELLRLSVSVSDNTAARLLLQRVGGVETVNRTLGALGLTHTRLYADDRPNTTTAAEMGALLSWIATRTPPGPGGTSEDRSPKSQVPSPGPIRLPPAPAPQSLAALLALSQDQDWLTERLPQGVAVAHKSGQLPGLRHDAGIVYGPGGPFVVVVLTDDLANQGEAERAIAALARRLHDHFQASQVSGLR
ncbi:MAG TPA: serine hydrolase [Chloroflexota bacterium]|nr:serine hydrolase [Chloroflexota bacterium]